MANMRGNEDKKVSSAYRIEIKDTAPNKRIDAKRENRKKNVEHIFLKSKKIKETHKLICA